MKRGGIQSLSLCPSAQPTSVLSSSFRAAVTTGPSRCPTPAHLPGPLQQLREAGRNPEQQGLLKGRNHPAIVSLSHQVSSRTEQMPLAWTQSPSWRTVWRHVLILAGAYEVVLLHVAGLRGWRGRRAGRRGGGPEQHCTAGRGAASVNGCGLVFSSEPQDRNPEQEYEVLG